jgi:hypothetical protein
MDSYSTKPTEGAGLLQKIDFQIISEMAFGALTNVSELGVSGGQVALQWAPALVVLLFLGILTKHAFNLSQTLWKESKANEWMIVMRNGEMVKCGIGLQTWVMPHDQTVTFPSLINEVNFTAQ